MQAPVSIENAPGLINDGEIDFREIGKTLWQGRYTVLVCLAMGLLGSAVYAVSATPQYKADVLIMSTAQAQSSPGLSSRYAGLAELAGVSLPGSGNAEEALAVLRSRAFVSSFIQQANILPALFESIWDGDAKQWKDGVAPTANQATNAFQRIFSVNEVKRTNQAVVSVVWKDGAQATQWANQLVSSVNALMRERAIAEAEKTMSYLQQEITGTSSVEVRQAMYGLIESQVKTIALARTQEQYAFKVLDPAVVPDANEKVFPKKRKIVGFGAAAGILFGSLFILIRRLLKKN